MCSIAGGVAGIGVGGMLHGMQHRAPDGINLKHLEDFTMGMGRLAILDLENKEFPMEREGRVLSFNGEIYNYLELRQQLEEFGRVFITEGDTEVLLQAYLQWGEKCLDKLNGMFAFAIYDNGKVFLARDIAGEKPLYFSYPSSGAPFHFASEAKVVRRGVVELQPAHCAWYDIKSNTIEVKRWWNFVPREINLETAEEELEALLEDSIRLRTRSDVPYALYLSEGVDSNLIHSFKPGDREWSTFTYHDEIYFKEDFEKDAEKILWHLDYPIDSFSPFGLWKLAESASREGFKVVLSGEGADELFGGYVRYVPRALNLKARDEFPSYTSMFPVDEEDPGWKDFNGKMQGLLRMGDRMASAFGIENRCPFLDRRIIEFAFSLPDELRAYGFDTKVILRRILKKRNPNYEEKEKHGLYVSVNKWMGESDPLSKSKWLAYQNEQWQKSQ